jgi:glutathione S-transferase
MIKLHVFMGSPRGFKAIAVAEHLGFNYEVVPLDAARGDHKTPEFAALNPNMRIPVLEEDGFALWESNAIMQYLASRKPESGLLPSDPRERAEVNRWQFWESAHWDPACATIALERVIKKLFGLGDVDPVRLAEGEQNFTRLSAVLDSHLKGRKFVTGNNLTVADFSIGAWLNSAERAQFPVEQFKEIKRWHATLAELPSWRKVRVPIPGR